ncbi:hypothetical protein ACLKA6_006901 [Drosophila palustris]
MARNQIRHAPSPQQSPKDTSPQSPSSFVTQSELSMSNSMSMSRLKNEDDCEGCLNTLADVCFWPCFTRQSAQQHCEGGCNSCPKASINGLDPAAEADDEDEDEDEDEDADVVGVVVGVVARLSEMPLGSSWSVQQAAFVIAC